MVPIHVEVTLLNGKTQVVNLNNYDFGFKDADNKTILIPARRNNLGNFSADRLVIEESFSAIISSSCRSWFEAVVTKAPKIFPSGGYIFRKGHIDGLEDTPLRLKTNNVQVFVIDGTYATVRDELKCTDVISEIGNIKSELQSKTRGKPITLIYTGFSGSEIDLSAESDDDNTTLTSLELPNTINDFIVYLNGQRRYLGPSNDNPHSYNNPIITFDSAFDDVDLAIEIYPQIAFD